MSPKQIMGNVVEDKMPGFFSMNHFLTSAKKKMDFMVRVLVFSHAVGAMRKLHDPSSLILSAPPVGCRQIPTASPFNIRRPPLQASETIIDHIFLPSSRWDRFRMGETFP